MVRHLRRASARHPQSSSAIRVALAGAWLSWMVPAQAQDSSSSDRNLEGIVNPAPVREELVVTGSRVTRDGYEAPTPVTVASSEQLELAAPSTLSDALNQLPSFRGSSKPQNVSVASTGTNGGSFLNLRGLGPQRTLILLDGQRIVPSSGSGVPDTSILPQKLVKRVDIVTGGASAAYGSDAVAGVVNFVLDTDYRGLKADVQAGTSNYSDNDSTKVSLTGGTGLFDNKLSIIFSGEYYKADPVDGPNGRDWAEAGWGLIPNATGQTPRLVLRNNVTNSHTTYNGLITGSTTNPALVGTEFLPNGGTRPFTFGDLRSSVYMVGGDGILDFVNISAGVERWSTFARATYDFTDSIDAYVETSLADSRSDYRQRNPGNVAANQLRIFGDNAFLPDSIRQQMTSTQSFTMGRTNRDWGPIWADSTNRTWRVAAGMNAHLSDGWSFNVRLSHGENGFLTHTNGNQNYRHLFAAADAVRDSSGNIVCRSTLQGLDPGCVPINLFGDGSPSQAAIDYVTGSAFYDMTLKQDVAGISAQASPFETWAGPVDIAFGAEYRKESAAQVVDEISLQTLTGAGLRGFPAGNEGNRGGWSHTNPQPIDGEYDIKEGFVEVVVPLADEMRFARHLELNGAFRLTDYSTSGAVNTWKVGLSYEPFDGLRFRGTRSRDIRAANITELFTGSRQSSGTVRQPGTSSFRNFIGSTQGNPDLDPEEADALTVGVVYMPSWLEGFTISADVYNIEIAGAISSFGAQQTLDICAQGSAVACSQIVDNNGVYNIRLPFLNLDKLETRGMDVESSYRKGMLGGDMEFRLILNYTDEFIEEDAGGVRDEQAGDVGTAGMPKWGGTFGITYRRDALALFLQERYIGGGVYDRTLVEGVDLADNHLSAEFYTDFTARYQLFDARTEIFATINNLFNREPPIAPQQSSERFRATNFALYDAIGRYYTAGVRVKF
jgi:outer membrane receptor protein involved in Fe transport